MVVINEEIKEFLKGHLAYVGTVDPRGNPNVVPKGNIAILDTHTLVFADLYSHQTKKNLMANSNIAVTVVNPAAYRGFQIRGKAKVIERGPEYEKLKKRLQGDGQLNHAQAKYAVRIKVNKIINIGYGESADKEIR